MDYLIENTEKFNSGEWKFPYWTLYKSNIIPEGKVKDFLGNVDGYYINCSGFDELIRLEPGNAGFYIDLSMTLRERDKDAEAAAQAEKAIGLDPQNARCYASLGRTLHKMGRDKEAKEALETAVRLAPENDFYKKDLEEVLQKLK